MTNSQITPTLKQEIEELEKKANTIAQTAKIRHVNSESFVDYREGFLDGERLTGASAMKIIGKLQEIIEMQQQALKVLSDGNDDGYVFESAGEDGDFFYVYADHILEETKQLMGGSKCKLKH